MNFKKKYGFFFIFLIFTVSVFFVSIYNKSHVPFLRSIGIPAKSPLFIDTHVITTGMDCLRLGYNVLVKNPCDILNRPLNYPKIWHSLNYFGVTESSTLYIGFILCFLYFFSIFSFFKKYNFDNFSYYIGFLIISPSLFLCLERGNIDLLNFFLLYLSLELYTILNKKYTFISTFPLLLASLLKLYPIVAITYFLNSKNTIFKYLFFLVGLIFIFYVYTIKDDLKDISAATPNGILISYGVNTLPQFLIDKELNFFIFSSKLFSIQLLCSNFIFYFNEFAFSINLVFPFAFSIIFLILFFEIFTFKKLKETNFNFSNQIDEYTVNAFLIGSTIYSFTYFLGNNWDYRMIFLLFCIPFLINIYKYSNNNSMKFYSILYLSIFIINCYSNIVGFVFNFNFVYVVYKYFFDLLLLYLNIHLIVMIFNSKIQEIIYKICYKNEF